MVTLDGVTLLPTRRRLVGEGGVRPIYPWNRKFIGCKQNLLPFIGAVIDACCPEARTACDPFCGTAAVAYYLAQRGMAVVAGDNLRSCALPAQAFLTTPRALLPRLARLIQELNGLPGEAGYVYQNFGGTYFTAENAARIDAVRERIAAWAAAGRISPQEEAVLITSLLYAADKVANTCGQYDAYLKHLGQPPYSNEGTHQVDASVYRPLALGLPQPAPQPHRHRVVCGDALALVRQVEVDLLYLDPPYNTRQYADNYHVLENIARWEKPPLHGKTRKFDRRGLKSPFSARATAAAALAQIIAAARCRHILLSYNNEGIIPVGAILAALAQRGPVTVFTCGYQVFGNGAGRSRRRAVQERLYYCQVQAPPA